MSRSRLPGLARVDLLLALGVFAIVAALVAPLWRTTLSILDVRQWPSAAWLALNFVVLFALLAVIYGPSMLQPAGEKKKRPVKRTPHDDQKKLEEERQLYARLKEARKRQIV